MKEIKKIYSEKGLGAFEASCREVEVRDVKRVFFGNKDDLLSRF